MTTAGGASTTSYTNTNLLDASITTNPRSICLALHAFELIDLLESAPALLRRLKTIAMSSLQHGQNPDTTGEEHQALLPQRTTLPQTNENEGTERNGSSGMSRSQAVNLYASHLLSTWNARSYEFAAVRRRNLNVAWADLLVC